MHGARDRCRRVLCAAVLFGAALPALAQLGTVTLVGSGPQFCETQRHPLTLPGETICAKVNVACPGADPKDVFLRINGPAPEVARRGTIVFGLGGAGLAWYEQSPAARELLIALMRAGYRTVQRAWQQNPQGTGGWLEDSTSLNASSCRYASLITWIHDNPLIHDPPTGFCATGNSGGSMEIGYALSRWGRETILDLAVPTAGPPTGRADKPCIKPATQPQYGEWIAECNSRVSAKGICPPQFADGPQCSYSPLQVQNRIDIAFNLSGTTPCADEDFSTLLDNSVLFPGADLDYPDTRVEFLIGVADCTVAAPAALEYIDAVIQASSGGAALRVLPETGHGVQESVVGTNAIRRAMLDHCAPGP